MSQFPLISIVKRHQKKELVKKIIIRPDGSIRIEWNFCDEMNEPISFDFSGKATPEEKAM